MSDDFVFTSESTAKGHPDKLCDQVSDAIVDDFLRQDPASSIVAECAIASGVLFIAARYASRATPGITDVARETVRAIGYPRQVFDADESTILTSYVDCTDQEYEPLALDRLDEESVEHMTAKNMVTAFGFACRQTPSLMPLPIVLAHRLANRLDAPEVLGGLPYLLPDGQAQVSIEYRAGKPKRIHGITLVASQVESGTPDLAELRGDLIRDVIEPVCEGAACRLDNKTEIFVNPEGPLIGGGPRHHAGLTGRKTGVDTYGEYARHSGAALSGKDPSRIDRVAAYAARYAAKNVVAARLADECEIALSYTCGAARPVSVRVRTFGAGMVDNDEIARRIADVFDFRLGAIMRDLELREPRGAGGFYQKLAVYGQMGRTDLDAPWERTDRAVNLA